MSLHNEISDEVRREFLQIAVADRLDPKAIGRLMDIVDQHAFALYGLRHTYQKQLEAGIFQDLIGKPMAAFNEDAVDRIARRIDDEFQPGYLASVRTTIELEKKTLSPDQWIPIQAFLDRRFPLVQDRNRTEQQ